MTLEEAIAQLVDLGESDPVELARKLEARYDSKWIDAQLAEHRLELVAEIARQFMGSRRRSATKALAVATEAPKREVLLGTVFIPGQGHKKIGELTAEDCDARERFYVAAAGTFLRYAGWFASCAVAIRKQGVARLADVRGALPALEEAS